MDINILQYLFLSMTFFIVVMGSLVNWLENYLPVILLQTFRYGKFAYEGKPSNIQTIEVPKKWFKHFYVFSSLYCLYALYLVIDIYMYEAKPSSYLLQLFDFLGGSNRNTRTSSSCVILCLSLLTLQSFRRFYETHFISVFSDGKMNLSHYMVGFIHYWGTITAILVEATGINETGHIQEQSSYYVTAMQILGTLLFFYGWFHQYKTALILANLRKNTKGCVVSTQHRLPNGGLFKYVSSPHLTCEVLIYFSLWLILSGNSTFKFVFIWVLSNQFETSLLNHWWYKKTFKNYPVQRKAFIPFVV